MLLITDRNREVLTELNRNGEYLHEHVGEPSMEWI